MSDDIYSQYEGNMSRLSMEMETVETYFMNLKRVDNLRAMRGLL